MIQIKFHKTELEQLRSSTRSTLGLARGVERDLAIRILKKLDKALKPKKIKPQPNMQQFMDYYLNNQVEFDFTSKVEDVLKGYYQNKLNKP